jgi:hypothetical protein
MLKYLPNKRGFPRLRFGLRTLLTALALVAVACWLYWYCWPRYQAHLEQIQFEATVRDEFRRGRTLYDARKFGGLADKLVGYSSDAKGKSIAYIRREWPNASYVIYGPHKQGSGALQEYVEFESVEVFRLARVPQGYRPQTERGKKALAHSPKGNYFESPASLAYRNDFIEMISGDRRDDLGIQYELIHSVPSKGG